MNLEKKNMIINEIYYWKKNKLLPDTYCDFLLALYTEGDQRSETIVQKDHPRHRSTLIFGFLISLLLANLLVIYFTEISIVLQISLVSFFLVASIVVTAYFIRKQIFFQGALSVTLLQILIGSLTVIEFVSNGSSFGMGFVIVINCLFWISLGFFGRLLYLLMSGLIGLFIFLLTVLF